MRKLTTVLILTLCLGAGTAGAQERFALTAIDDAGNPWTGFGNNSGVVESTFPGFPGAVARDVKLDKFGRLLVAGDSKNGSFLLARYHAGGTLDTSFNSPYGWIATDLTNGIVGGLALFDDGEIIVAGTSSSSPTFVRYKENGMLDPSFPFNGGGGVLVWKLAREAHIFDVAVEGDAIIGVGTYLNYYNQHVNSAYLAVRLVGDGYPDNGFGDGNGVAIHEDQPGEHYDNLEVAKAVAIDSKGRLVLGGYLDDLAFGPRVMTGLRLHSDGKRDASFAPQGIPGTVYVQFQKDYPRENSESSDVQIDSQGRVILAGRGWHGRDQFALARLDSEGRLDASFDGNGKAMTDFGWDDAAIHGMTQASNGDLVVAGRVGTSTSKMAFARYEAGNGALDTTFDNDGILVLDCPGDAELNAIAADNDGRFFAVGWSDGPMCAK